MALFHISLFILVPEYFATKYETNYLFINAKKTYKIQAAKSRKPKQKYIICQSKITIGNWFQNRTCFQIHRYNKWARYWLRGDLEIEEAFFRFSQWNLDEKIAIWKAKIRLKEFGREKNARTRRKRDTFGERDESSVRRLLKCWNSTPACRWQTIFTCDDIFTQTFILICALQDILSAWD